MKSKLLKFWEVFDRKIFCKIKSYHIYTLVLLYAFINGFYNVILAYNDYDAYVLYRFNSNLQPENVESVAIWLAIGIAFIIFDICNSIYKSLK